MDKDYEGIVPRLRSYGGVFALLELAPYSRERPLVQTEIEEAVFWANAAIARNETPPAPSEESV